MIGQGVPDEPAGDGHLVGAPGEGPRGVRGDRGRRGPFTGHVTPALLLGHGQGRTGHIGLRIMHCYCQYLQCNSKLTIVHAWHTS